VDVVTSATKLKMSQVGAEVSLLNFTDFCTLFCESFVNWETLPQIEIQPCKSLSVHVLIAEI